MSIKRILGVLSLILLFAPVMPGLPSARASAGTQCTFEYDVVTSPGLSTSPNSGTVTTNGETGTSDCNGPVNGQQPTGGGTAGVKERYGTGGADTCQSGGEGDGVISMTNPAGNGPERITNNVTYECSAFSAGAPFSATFEGDRMSGTMGVTPIDGDCASKQTTCKCAGWWIMWRCAVR